MEEQGGLFGKKRRLTMSLVSLQWKKCPIDNFLFGSLQGKAVVRRIVCAACGAEASRRGEEK